MAESRPSRGAASTVPIVETVATDGTGAEELWTAIETHRARRQRAASSTDVESPGPRTSSERSSSPGLREQALDRCAGERWTAALDQIRRRDADPWTVVDELLD